MNEHHILHKLSIMEENTNKRFMEMNQQLNIGLTKTDDKIDTLATSVTNNTEKIDTLTTSVTDNTAKIDTLTTSVTANTDKVGSLSHSVAELTTTVEGHGTKVENPRGAVVKNTNKIDTLTTDVREVKVTTKRIEQSMPEDITAMLKVIEQKVDNKHAETSVLNHRLFNLESTVQKLIDS